MKKMVSAFIMFLRDHMRVFLNYLSRNALINKIAKSTVEAIAVFVSVKVVEIIFRLLFPNAEWYAEAIRLMSHVMAILHFLISFIRELRK